MNKPMTAMVLFSELYTLAIMIHLCLKTSVSSIRMEKIYTFLNFSFCVPQRRHACLEKHDRIYIFSELHSYR